MCAWSAVRPLELSCWNVLMRHLTLPFLSLTGIQMGSSVTQYTLPYVLKPNSHSQDAIKECHPPLWTAISMLHEDTYVFVFFYWLFSQSSFNSSQQIHTLQCPIINNTVQSSILEYNTVKKKKVYNTLQCICLRRMLLAKSVNRNLSVFIKHKSGQSV